MSTDTRGREAVIDLRDVSFGYGPTLAVEHLSLRIDAGEFAAVLGPNGSGKSTLVKLALGLLRPDAGIVRLFGQDPVGFTAWDRLGYVPQVVTGAWREFPATVGEMVAHGAYRGPSPLAVFRRSDRPEVRRALDAVGMVHVSGLRLAELSVGQQQRVLLARALVRRPELILLDEPAAGVDASGEEQLYAILRDLNRSQGMTVVLVSHDIGAMLREATTIACIDRTLVKHGPPHELTNKELSSLYGIPVDILIHDALHEHR
jgi:zinc transport system ATP-binding protein